MTTLRSLLNELAPLTILRKFSKLHALNRHSVRFSIFLSNNCQNVIFGFYIFLWAFCILCIISFHMANAKNGYYFPFWLRKCMNIDTFVVFLDISNFY